ncbi:hypothetical protein [Pseudarthrobacter sp. C4D7]|uniref:TolB family protein n=1 Tax=Pseudarthrobacter sp. C4D7 TaxID=2735268 RepID=UPI0015851206|nr:hypothetical protein [Pseudarthrobacter sp. C4D7]NUT70216.1 hypothetical protein [Pseudarthrobacter sp. C4D7]
MTLRARPTGNKGRWAILLLVAAIALAGAGIFAVQAVQRFQDDRAAASEATLAPGGPSLPAEPFVLFRNTASGQAYGQAATVSLSDPSGARSVSGVDCDRTYGSRTSVICLRTQRGVVTRFEASVYDRTWQQQAKWPLRGIPSRARMDNTGTAVATTVFVTGHSYAGAGFSTETTITSVKDGGELGSLEGFVLLVNGERITAEDRNIWGVTFVPGQADAFYATAASSGRIWLVKGSVSGRTLTAVYDGAECPSLSPDGSRLAYKKNAAGPLDPHWNIAVLDLADGGETVLQEAASVDDQVEWLDNNTLLYGLPRPGEPGDSDIWQIAVAPGSTPAVFIEHAWSPSVIR